MRKKSIFILIFLICFTSNVYKVRAIGNTDTKIGKDASSFISNIKDFIVDHTPSFIKKSINSTVAMIESFRQGLANLSEKTKISLTTQIKTQDTEKNDSIQKDWKSKITPLLKKIELFFTNLSFIILTSKISFYAISIILFILFIRFIWIRIL